MRSKATLAPNNCKCENAKAPTAGSIPDAIVIIAAKVPIDISLFIVMKDDRTNNKTKNTVPANSEMFLTSISTLPNLKMAC